LPRRTTWSSRLAVATTNPSTWRSNICSSTRSRSAALPAALAISAA